MGFSATSQDRAIETSHRVRARIRNLWIVVTLALLFSAPVVQASPPPTSRDLDALICKIDRTALSSLQARILSAPTLGEARQIATADTQQVYEVLRRARFFAPGSDSLQTADERLAAYHLSVAQASTPTQIAASFGKSFQPLAAGGCDYSTGELIAIVLGLLLGLIPGLILLILLC